MPKTILAVDDSIALRIFIQKTLSQHPDEFTLHLAKDATEGLSKAGSTKPDLVLLDYILPEMTGGDVCARLMEKPETSKIPIVLMSSNVHDIKRSEGQFSSIVKSIAKPFTSELLTSLVRSVLRSIEEKTAPAPQPPVPAPVNTPAPIAAFVPAGDPAVLFHGRSDFFPLYRCFTTVQENSLTGVLRLKVGKLVSEVYFQKGRPILNTTRDVAVYIDANPYPFTPAQVSELPGAKAKQAESGTPVFVTLAGMGLFSEDKVAAACREQGAKFLSQIWVTGRVSFEFEALDASAVIHGPLAPCSDGVDAWMIESLRHVGEQALSAIAWGDLGGVPIYTRHGYERIQQIKLTREEVRFLGQVGSSTLAEMAKAAGMSPERAQEILFRFLSLEIFEYWPAAILRGEA